MATSWLPAGSPVGRASSVLELSAAHEEAEAEAAAAAQAETSADAALEARRGRRSRQALSEALTALRQADAEAGR